MFVWARKYVEIKAIAGSVGIFVYMALASVVKRRAPGGSWRREISVLNVKESLK